MVNKLVTKGKSLLLSPQTSILSAATVIMLMSATSRLLGLARQSVLSHFFTPSELALFFAAFRLPDLVFEVLVFGTFSSAFIPVFTRTLGQGEGRAWRVAGTVVNIGLLFFAGFALIFGIFAETFYSLIAPGFVDGELARIAFLARILFAAQGFFVVSYVLTGVLESLRRFLIPALAPIFYNLGIIGGTLFLTPYFGLTAPAVGVVLGAGLHFLIQLPLAYQLGFRFLPRIKIDAEVKKIGKLAAPRVIDLSFQQIGKTVELFFSSLISSGAYTYLTFANTLQLVPVSLFGTSLAKAALPTLARKDKEPQQFCRTILSTFYEVIFLVLPIATALIVLRIPVIRLVYGRAGFDWQATIHTGYVLTAFALGIPFQAAVALLARGFYALHDTRTPVKISILGVILMVLLDILLVLGLGLPTWALAASFSLSAALQTILLYFLLMQRLKTSPWQKLFPLAKSLVGSLISGGVMYFILKFFDRSVWVKKLSFVKSVDLIKDLPFQSFVLDTRYTINLLILTLIVSLVGALVYLILAVILKSNELAMVLRMIQKRKFTPPAKEPELISPSAKEISE